jgi:hypothetical protein
MEERRLVFSFDEVEASFHRLTRTVDGTPAHSVFDIDQLGHQEWADRQEKTCDRLSGHHQEKFVSQMTPTSVRCRMAPVEVEVAGTRSEGEEMETWLCLEMLTGDAEEPEGEENMIPG